MPESDLWTLQEIADEISKPRQFVIDIVLEKNRKHVLHARKIGRSWLVNDSEARAFIERFRNPQPEWYTINTIAKAIGKSHKYVKDALTGYGGRKEPRLAGVKRGTRWCIGKEEGDRFVREHKDP
jgi:3-methyladenine DNA glycosylase AlkD